MKICSSSSLKDMVPHCNALKITSFFVILKPRASKMASARPKFKKNEEIEAFIAEYEKEEVLWNVLLTAYKDRDARQAGVARLAQKLRMTGKVEYLHDFVNS